MEIEISSEEQIKCLQEQIAKATENKQDAQAICSDAQIIIDEADASIEEAEAKLKEINKSRTAGIGDSLFNSPFPWIVILTGLSIFAYVKYKGAK